jgi:hypothetical protein
LRRAERGAFLIFTSFTSVSSVHRAENMSRQSRKFYLFQAINLKKTITDNDSNPSKNL